MAGNRTIIEVEQNKQRETYDLYVVRKKYDGQEVTREYAVTAWEPKGECQEIEPALRVGYEEAQNLLDALYSRGLRPSGEKLTEYRAQGKHLEDMRALAFGKLGVAKP